MTQKLLGFPFDIHGGGGDLLFPHHENECAQAMGVHDDGFARYWLHNGMITVEGEKMSKSLGNILTTSSLLASHHPDVLRWALMSSHYRQSLDWRAEVLTQSRQAIKRYYWLCQRWQFMPEAHALHGEDMDGEVLQALAQDLNTPLMMSRLYQLMQEVEQVDSEDKAHQGLRRLMASMSILGVGQSWASWDTFGQQQSGMTHQDIDAVVAERTKARQAKDYARADQLRDELQAAGVEMMDGRDPGVPLWRWA